MNEINRHIDDVVVKAGIRERGRWQVSSMDWPRYFQVVGKSGKGLVGFVGDSASGTCEVLCQRVGQAHAVPTVSVEGTELVNLVKGEQTYATGISVPAARFLIEADLIRQASQPGLSTSTAPEGLSQELADMVMAIYEWADNDFGAGGADVRVAYLDAVPYVWVDRACIIRLVEGNVGIVELVRPCGEVWREGLWETVTRRLTEEDERVLDEVNRQRRAHAAASSSPVETP